MVALMEDAALELAKSYLEEGQTTVGAEIRCRHLAPTPVGMKVTATAKLRSIERRKLWFDIEVNDEKGKCGEGSHLRVIVNSKAMSEKAGEKGRIKRRDVKKTARISINADRHSRLLHETSYSRMTAKGGETHGKTHD